MEQPLESEDTIDIAEFLRRLRRDLPLTIGRAAAGLGFSLLCSPTALAPR